MDGKLNPRVPCKLCAKKVTDDSYHKWRHVLKYHPEMVMSNLGPLLQNPKEAYRFGVELGRMFRERLGL